MYKIINGWTKDKMIKHIEKNFKGKSFINNDDCLYRTEDGRKCAVGLFIPDDKYRESMENIWVPNVVRDYGLEEFMPLNNLGLSALQRVHDESAKDETLGDMLAWINENVEDS
jgi:hypothetical protein